MVMSWAADSLFFIENVYSFILSFVTVNILLLEGS